MRAVRDSEGQEVNHGDVVSFCYGIPPIGVRAPVIRRDGKLIAITKGHNPSETSVSSLHRHVGYFRKLEPCELNGVEKIWKSTLPTQEANDADS